MLIVPDPFYPWFSVATLLTVRISGDTHLTVMNAFTISAFTKLPLN